MFPGYSFRVTVSMYKSNTISENRSRRRRHRHPVVLLSSKTGRQVAPDRQMAPPTSPARLLLNRELAPTRAN